MCHAMQISPTSLSLISRSLRALEKEGKIVLRKEGRKVSISLHENKLPLLGKISAGLPIDALENHTHLEFDWLFQPGHFALVVIGTSMIEENICDGDIIICRSTKHADEGDIIVALIDGQNTTLKKVSFKLPHHITLIPANRDLKPRAYPAERILIQGIFVGLFRKSM